MDTSISSIALFLENIDFVLDKNQSVKDFERTIEDQTELHMQVFGDRMNYGNKPQKQTTGL